jgi:hypothetical protein
MSSPPFAVWPPIVSASGGGISSIGSADGSIVIANPTGPAVDLRAITGNPYIDNWGTPDPMVDDEFDSGSDNLLARGWSVYNYATGLPLTYGGKITNPAVSGTPTEFRSARYGSYMVVQIALGSRIVMSKPVVESADQYYTVRVGVPWGRSLASGNSSATVLSGEVQIAVVRSANNVGTSPMDGTDWHKMFIGQRAGANAYYGWERPGFQKIMDPTDQYSSSVLHGVTGMACRSTGLKLTDLAALETESGSVRIAFREESGSENTFVAKQVGFQCFSTETGGVGGPMCTFMIDYFRRRDGLSWYGLS